MELLKEFETDRNTIYTMKSKLESETGKLEHYKEAKDTYETQAKRLLEENSQLLDEVKHLREIKRELEIELDKKRDLIEHLQSSLKKDEDHMRMYETQVQAYLDEVNHHKTAVMEYRDIAESRKREHVESNQRFIKEIEAYQYEIEKLEKDREALRKRVLELEGELNNNKFTHGPLGTNEVGIQNNASFFDRSKVPGTSMVSSVLPGGLLESSKFTDPITRYSQIDREL